MLGALSRKASDYHEHDNGISHSHEGGSKPHTHTCTCTEQGRDIACSEHGG